MASRNPPWQRDELILALDLYFRHRPDTIGKAHPEVTALSELLNALPIHPDRPDQKKFRNVYGTYMKLCNFLALDPAYQGKGLVASGKLERAVPPSPSGGGTGTGAATTQFGCHAPVSHGVSRASESRIPALLAPADHATIPWEPHRPEKRQ